MSKQNLARIDAAEPRRNKRSGADGSLDMSVLESKIGYLLHMADRVMGRDFVKDVGMTRVQYSVFSLVATNDGLSQVQIGDALDMDRASTMAIVNKLEAAGLIERRASTVDRRRHALQLTAAGKRSFPGVNRRVIEHEDRLQQQLSTRDQKMLLDCLTRILRS